MVFISVQSSSIAVLVVSSSTDHVLAVSSLNFTGHAELPTVYSMFDVEATCAAVFLNSNRTSCDL